MATVWNILFQRNFWCSLTFCLPNWSIPLHMNYLENITRKFSWTKRMVAKKFALNVAQPYPVSRSVFFTAMAFNNYEITHGSDWLWHAKWTTLNMFKKSHARKKPLLAVYPACDPSKLQAYTMFTMHHVVSVVFITSWISFITFSDPAKSTK